MSLSRANHTCAIRQFPRSNSSVHKWTQHKCIYFSTNFARISSKKIAKIHIFSGLFNLTVLGSNQFGTGSGIFKYLENWELNCMPSQKNRDRTEPNFGSVLSVLVLCISSELNFGNTMGRIMKKGSSTSRSCSCSTVGSFHVCGRNRARRSSRARACLKVLTA